MWLDWFLHPSNREFPLTMTDHMAGRFSVMYVCVCPCAVQNIIFHVYFTFLRVFVINFDDKLHSWGELTFVLFLYSFFFLWYVLRLNISLIIILLYKISLDFYIFSLDFFLTTFIWFVQFNNCVVFCQISSVVWW